jgi:hypothetical protein
VSLARPAGCKILAELGDRAGCLIKGRAARDRSFGGISNRPSGGCFGRSRACDALAGVACCSRPADGRYCGGRKAFARVGDGGGALSGAAADAAMVSPASVMFAVPPIRPEPLPLTESAPSTIPAWPEATKVAAPAAVSPLSVPLPLPLTSAATRRWPGRPSPRWPPSRRPASKPPAAVKRRSASGELVSRDQDVPSRRIGHEDGVRRHSPLQGAVADELGPIILERDRNAVPGERGGGSCRSHLQQDASAPVVTAPPALTRMLKVVT